MHIPLLEPCSAIVMLCIFMIVNFNSSKLLIAALHAVMTEVAGNRRRLCGLGMECKAYLVGSAIIFAAAAAALIRVFQESRIRGHS
jgi:hypothetical protein